MSFDASKIKEGNAKAIGILVLVAIAAFFIIKYGSEIGNYVKNLFGGISDKLGLTDTKNATDADTYLNQQDNNQILGNAPFNPNLYNSAPSGSTVFTDDEAGDISLAFWNCGGIFYTDGQGVVAAVQRCRTQVQVSQVAQDFADTYASSLYPWLRKECVSGVNRELLSEAVKYANSLPMYN